MTTPTETNGMAYSALATAIVAPTQESARGAAIHYGIDIDAPAGLMYVILSHADVDLLDLAGFSGKWCISEMGESSLVARMRNTYGAASTQADTFAVVNNNIAWGKKWANNL